MVRQMSDEHREALHKARAENRAVNEYLAAVEENRRIEEMTRPKRGRRRTTESMQNRLNEIAEVFDSATPLKRLVLIQERMNLEAELEEAMKPQPEPIDLTELEADFLEVAASLGQRKRISYRAWREFGVEPSVLKQAGIRLTRKV